MHNLHRLPDETLQRLLNIAREHTRLVLRAGQMDCTQKEKASILARIEALRDERERLFNGTERRWLQNTVDERTLNRYVRDFRYLVERFGMDKAYGLIAGSLVHDDAYNWEEKKVIFDVLRRSRIRTEKE